MEKSSKFSRAVPLLRQVLMILLPFLLFLYAGQGLSHWLVDDAGVSMSYARNLAEGFGLTAQPGTAAVEGYSDPAWVLLLALLAKCGFSLLSAVKAASFLFSLLIFILLGLICRQMKIPYLAAFFSMLWLALQPSFVIWAVSGLENALYGSLMLALVGLTLQDETNCRALLAGAAAGLLALTRPEGLVFLAAYLIFHRKRWYLFTAAFTLVFGSYFIFRLFYFGVPFANTYYMKMEGIYGFKDFLIQIYYKFRLLGNGTAGSIGFWFFAAAVLVLIVTALVKKFKPARHEWVVLVFAVLALGTYLILPNDWMGELRFATGFLVLFPLLISVVLARLLDGLKIRQTRWLAGGLYSFIFLCLVLLTATDFAPRLKKFAQSPTVPLADVAAASQESVRYAQILGVSDFSVLQADVGGALWENRYRVIDLGGLVDPVIARTLGKDEAALREYVLAKVKPDMIELHGKWSQRADLQADERFQEDYRPLFTYTEPSRKYADGRDVISGFYVRNEIVKSEDDWQRLISYRESK